MPKSSALVVRTKLKNYKSKWQPVLFVPTNLIYTLSLTRRLASFFSLVMQCWNPSSKIDCVLASSSTSSSWLPPCWSPLSSRLPVRWGHFFGKELVEETPKDKITIYWLKVSDKNVLIKIYWLKLNLFQKTFNLFKALNCQILKISVLKLINSYP